MKKANKILMAAVAILLCLVLISTSILSGVFAKFVHQRAMDATMTFKHLGVTVTMSAETDRTALVAAGATISTEVKNGKSGTITISGLKMRPGLDFSRAVKFEFGKQGETQKLSVPAEVRITTTVEYDDKVHKDTQNADKTITYYNYYVPAGKIIQSIASNGAITYMPQTYFMPIGFTFSHDVASANGNTNVALGSWTEDAGTGTDSKVIASAISDSIASGVSGRIKNANTSVSKNTVTIPFAKDSAVTFNINDGTGLTYFHMGFFYPLDRTATGKDADFYNRLATYIAEHTDPDCTITVSYTVELVQT